MPDIEQYGVQMVMENADFERKTRQTIDTLGDLRRTLDIKGTANAISKAIDDAGDSTKNNVDKIISSLKNSINGFGSQVKRMIQGDIIATGMNAGKSLLSSLTIEQPTKGWQKYNDKVKDTQTIMNATGKSADEVGDILNRLMRFSDETSFSFTEMTSALSTMSSSGADIEKSIPMIMGVAQATAYAGKSGQEFQSVMRNVTQSFSTGFLNLQDWKSIELMKVNSQQLVKTLIDAGVRLNKIKDGEVTIENFRDSLSTQWADRDVMEDAFGNWAAMMEEAIRLTDAGEFETVSEAIESISENYDEYVVKATQAAQSAKSWEEVVSATQDAVSSKWMETFDIIFGNYDDALSLWSDIVETMYEIFASGGDNRNDVLKKAFSTPFQNVREEVAKTGISVEYFDKAIEKVLTADGYDPEQLAEEYGSIEEAFNQGAVGAYKLKKALAELAKGSAEGAINTEEYTGRYKEFQEVVNNTWWGKFGSSDEQRMKALTEAGYDFALVQKLMSKTATKWNKDVQACFLTEEQFNEALAEYAKESKATIELTDEQREAAAKLAEEAKDGTTEIGNMINSVGTKMSGRELLAGSLKNFFQIILNIKEAFGYIFGQAFNFDGASVIYGITESLFNFSENVKNATALVRDMDGNIAGLENQSKPIQVLVRIVKGFATAVKTATGFVVDQVKKVSEGFKNLTAEAGGIDGIRGIFNNLKDSCVNAATGIQNAINKFMAIPIVNKAIGLVESAVGSLVELVSKIPWLGTMLTEGVSGGIISGIGNVVGAVVKLATSLFESFCNFLSIHSPSQKFEWASQMIIDGILNPLLNGEITLGTAVSKLAQVMTDAFMGSDSPLVKGLSSFKDFLLDGLKDGSIFSKIYAAAIGFGAIKIMGSISKTIVALGKPIEAAGEVIADFKGLGKEITGAFSEIKGTFGAFKGIFTAVSNAITKYGDTLGKAKLKQANSQIIKSIGISFGLIAASIYVLSKIPKDDLINASIAASGIAGAILILSATMSIIANSAHKNKVSPELVDSLSNALLKMAGAAAILALVAKIVGSMDPGELGQAGVFFIGFMALIGLLGMLGAALVNSKGGFTTEKMTQRLSSLVRNLFALEAAILVTGIIATMLGVVPILFLVKGLLAIAVIGKIITNLVSKLADIKKVPQVTLALISLSVAIGILGVIAAALGIVPVLFLAKGIVAVGLLSLIIVALLKSVSKIKQLPSVALSLSSLIVVIGILGAVAAILGIIPVWFLAKGILAVGLLSLIIVGLLKFVSNKVKDMPKITIALLALSVAIGVLGIVAALLGFVPFDKMLQGIGAVALLGVVIGLLIGLVSKYVSDAPKIIFALTALTGAIAILGIVAALLGFVPSDKMTQGAGAVALLGVIIALLIGLVSKYVSDAPKITMSLVALSVAIAALGVVAALLGLLPLHMIARGVGAVAALAVAIGFVVWASRGASDASKTIKSMIAVVVALSICVAVLSIIPWQSLLPAAVGLSLLMIALGGMSLMMSKAKFDAGSIGGVLLMILTLAAVTAALYILKDAPWQSLLAGAAALAGVILALSLAMKLMGSGNVLGGAVFLMMSVGILAMAFALQMLAAVPWTTLIAAGAALAILAIGLALASNLLSSPMAWIGGLVLAGLFLALAGAVYIVASAMSLLGPALSGIGIGMEELATRTASVEPLMDSFRAVLTTVGTEVLVLAIKMAAGLAILAAGIFIVGLAGSASLGGMLSLGAGCLVAALGIAALALSLQLLKPGFNAIGAGIEGLISQISLGMVEARAAFDVLKTGSVDSAKDMISGFSDAIKEAHGDLKEAGAAAGEEAAAGLGESGGGAGASSFIDGLINGISSGVGSLTSAIGDMFSGLDIAGPAGGAMDAAGDAMNTSVDGTTTVIADKLSSSSTWGFGKITELFSTEGGNIGESLTTSLSNTFANFNLSESLNPEALFGEGGFTSMFGDMSGFSMGEIDMSSLSNQVASLTGSGGDMMTNLADGIANNSATAVTAASTAAGDIISPLSSMSDDTPNIGFYMMDGLKTGLDNNKEIPIGKAREIAEEITRIIRDAQKIESPSKVQAETGMYIVLGLAKGMKDNASAAFSSAKDLSDGVTNTMTGAIASVAALFDSDLVENPSIRPVMDLSDIQNGIGTIDSMFSRQQAMAVTATASVGDVRRAQLNDLTKAVNGFIASQGERTTNNYNINGVTYDDGTNVATAVGELVHAAQIERRR